MVQPGEIEGIEEIFENAAQVIENNCDVEGLLDVFVPISKLNLHTNKIPPLGQRIAIAKDEAFSFIYPHLLEDWQTQDAEINFFSPLANECPQDDADAIFLPGGYPELHAEKLASADCFKQGMKKAADDGKLIYGECGGYMVLGQSIITAKGTCYPMTGLLDLETSFAKRKLHLGYRTLKADDFVLGNQLMAHEFHYTMAVKEQGEPLFEAEDALGNMIGKLGLRHGNVMGSYMHVIDRTA